MRTMCCINTFIIHLSFFFQWNAFENGIFFIDFPFDIFYSVHICFKWSESIYTLFFSTADVRRHNNYYEAGMKWENKFIALKISIFQAHIISYFLIHIRSTNNKKNFSDKRILCTQSYKCSSSRFFCLHGFCCCCWIDHTFNQISNIKVNLCENIQHSITSLCKMCKRWHSQGKRTNWWHCWNRLSLRFAKSFQESWFN